eukprot:TRINITY_DN1267_c0_g1_i1.p1 TRINITY_DN1267_c0_g1~~TRINITY_DN1267_c0_g1_i1.p1  ORF type:complete len:107 (-),score=18.54 TRINITY_DN1267_c0_g1_i1:83-403(-)
MGFLDDLSVGSLIKLAEKVLLVEYAMQWAAVAGVVVIILIVLCFLLPSSQPAPVVTAAANKTQHTKKEVASGKSNNAPSHMKNRRKGSQSAGSRHPKGSFAIQQPQ